MKIERLEGYEEATKALALAVAGVMAVLLIFDSIMLLLY